MKLKLSEHTDDSYWPMVPQLFNNINNFMWRTLGGQDDKVEEREKPVDWT